MALILRQATAVDVLIGPFVDETDGVTAEEGLSPTVLLSKNGQALGAANDGDCAHDDAGYFNCELDDTDTGTVGQLVLVVEGGNGALPVRHEFLVVEEATYDFLYAAGATPVADINAEADTALADYDPATHAELTSALGALNDLSAAEVNAEVDTALADYDGPTKAELDAGLASLSDPTAAAIADAVWDEDATGHQTAGTFGEALGDPAASGDSVRDLIAGLNDPTAAVVADAVWEEAIGDHSGTSGSTAEALDAASAPSAAAVAEAVWDEAKAGHVGAGSFGEEVQSHALSSEVAALNDLSAAEVNAEVDTALADYDAPTKAELDAGLAGLNDPTAGEVADAVWEEAIGDHQTAGTTGKRLDEAASAGDPWGTALPGTYGAGTAGYIVGNRLDVAVSSRVGGGAGALTRTIGVTAGGSPLEGASVWVATDEAGSNVVAGPLTTDSQGEVTVLLDAGTFYVWVQRDGYTAIIGQEVSVS